MKPYTDVQLSRMPRWQRFLRFAVDYIDDYRPVIMLNKRKRELGHYEDMHPLLWEKFEELKELRRQVLDKLP